jgi:hypothetical protein
MMSEHPQTVQWLLEERAVHERLGRTKHVELVNRELAKLGHEVEKPAATVQAKAPETAAKPKPSDNACDVCGREFKTSAALGSHARTHKGSKDAES